MTPDAALADNEPALAAASVAGTVPTGPALRPRTSTEENRRSNRAPSVVRAARASLQACRACATSGGAGERRAARRRSFH